MTKILLIGCGHAHLSILRRLLNEKSNNYEVTLISPSNEDVQIDCEKASVSFIEDTIISFDPLQKMLLGFSGEIYRFDVISFDIDMKFSLFKQALVPVAEDGTMLVEDTLQNAEFPFLFGAGDCVSIIGRAANSSESPDKQADVLWNNMKRYLKGQKLKPLNSGNSSSISSWVDRLFKRS